MRRYSWAFWAALLAACDDDGDDTIVHVDVYGSGGVRTADDSLICSDRSKTACNRGYAANEDVTLIAEDDVSGFQFRVWDNLLSAVDEGAPLFCPVAGSTDREVMFNTGPAESRHGCLAIFGDSSTPAPVITSIAPSSGQVGDAFSIFGSDLASPTVRIGDYENAVQAQPSAASTP